MKKKKKTNKKNNNPVKDLCYGVFFLAIAIILFILFKKGQGTPTTLLTEELGLIGAFIYRFNHLLFGKGIYYISFLSFIISIFLFFPKLNLTKKQIASLSIILITLLIYKHSSIEISNSITFGLKGEGGGLIGAIFSYILVKCFGTLITKLICVVFIVLSLIVLTNGNLFKWIQFKSKQIYPFLQQTKKEISNYIFDTKKSTGRTTKLINKEPFNSDKILKEKPLSDSKIKIKNDFVKNLEDINQIILNEQKNTQIKTFINETPYQNKSFELKEAPDYDFPSLDLLEKERISTQQNEKEIETNANILMRTLNDFGVKGTISGVSVGPSITEYEFQPAPGVKISKVLNLADDIALNLAANDVRIQAPIPGKAAVGIEIPNKIKSTVSIRSILESEDFQNAFSNLSVALGKDISGKSIVADLAKMPHLLIAGSTGSGKSVCLNTLIVSILYKAHPDEVKFLMIDPKMVELGGYNNIPHLITPVVTDSKKAASSLKWAVQEMENRYTLFSEVGVKDLERYNAKALELIALNSDSKIEVLPQILIIIDELADLMMVAPSEVEDSICRLAQMARAAGMHLIIATQRPSVDVITGIIKANIPSRIAFAVSSQIDSRTILDMNGAEKLLGQGDMLYFPRGIAKPIRVQGCYVSDREIDTVVDALKTQAKPIYNETIDDFSKLVESSENNEISDDAENDELLGVATKLFIENGQASISMLQRNFRIGYTRAARIIDALADLGYIGPYEGSKPRKVLITLDEYEKIFEIEE